MRVVQGDGVRVNVIRRIIILYFMYLLLFGEDVPVLVLKKLSVSRIDHSFILTTFGSFFQLSNEKLFFFLTAVLRGLSTPSPVFKDD